jgi:NADPH2:quinone reductase
MRAAFITQTGGPDSIRIGSLPDPTPGPRDVLVRVRAAAVNPIDTYVRSGMVAMPLSFPFVVGCDLAGEVVEVGAEVDTLRPGMRVWGSNQGLLGRQGTCAELAAVDERWLYRTPDAVSDREAAAAALVAITAHLGLVDTSALTSGETIFVNGGSGGVGSAVVQIAKALGARVIASAGTPAKCEQVRRLGADVVFDYHRGDLVEAVQAVAPGGVHVYWETLREPAFDQAARLSRRTVLRERLPALRLRDVQGHTSAAGRSGRRHQPVAGDRPVAVADRPRAAAGTDCRSPCPAGVGHDSQVGHTGRQDRHRTVIGFVEGEACCCSAEPRRSRSSKAFIPAERFGNIVVPKRGCGCG